MVTRIFVDAPAARRLAVPYSLGAAGLGAVGIVFRDFALQWQPVPVDLPHREALAILCGLTLVVGGLSLLIPRLTALAGLAAAGFDTMWAAVLLVPKVVAAPGSVVAWLGVAEIGSLAAGGAMIAATALGMPRAAIAARIVMGACALVFGLSHFAYATFTAVMVPHWLPNPLFWAYATGAGHTLAGLALIAGWRLRLTATALAAMCVSFVLLLHVPRVVANPRATRNGQCCSSHCRYQALLGRCARRRNPTDLKGGPRQYRA